MDIFTSPFGGVLGLIHIILFIYALIQIVSSDMKLGEKCIWLLIVGLLPVIGLLIYLMIGKKI